MIDLTAIPAERLALLDTETLYNGPHGPGGGDECQHCARELICEVVTGRHRDATPDGASQWLDILPALNDGPWRDDAHRTTVMRPYLRLMLALDPADDQARRWPFLDYVYRTLTPDLFDALKMPKEAAKFRDAPPVTDQERALVSALSRPLTRTRVIDLALGVALALAHAVDHLSSTSAIVALASALATAFALAIVPEARAVQWEQITRGVLDRICGIA